MMKQIIVDQTNYRQYNCGPKADNLFKLSAEGFNVPAFFCINFSDLNADSHLTLNQQMKTAILAKIKNEYQDVKSFSVRSSSMLEDGDKRSFAGQFQTFLNVGRSELNKCINCCLDSMSFSEASEYTNQQERTHPPVSMSVIVQEMVTAEMSGVVFTANPQGLLNEMVVIVGAGTGNNVVEDKIPVTTYYYNKTDSTYYYETKDGAILLDGKAFLELIDICKIISKDEYMDLEYALKDGKIYILQSRPITTIETKKMLILDNSNIVESYPGITLPLTYSFIHTAYTGVFKNVIQRVLKNQEQTEKYDPIFKEMIGTVNGRVYYKISNWYALIQLLPFSKKTLPVWQDMMGVRIKDVDEKKRNINFFMTTKVYFNSLIEYFRVPKNMKKLELEFTEIKQYFEEKYRSDLDNQQLKNLYDKLTSSVLSKWGITLLNDGYAFVFTGLLRWRLKKLGVNNYEQVTNDYISEITNIESMKPIRELINISNTVMIENKRADLLLLATDDEVDKYLNREGRIQNMISSYIHNFGDRAIEELKLESATFRSSPILLIKRILEYTSDEEKLASVTQSFEKTTKQTSNFFENKIVSFLSKRAVLGINNREISRLNRSRLYGMARTIFSAIANNFKNAGFIEDSSDIFYLTTDEIFSFIAGKEVDLMSIINSRKHEYELYELLPSYSRLIFAENEFNKVHQNVNAVHLTPNITEIVGTPCSNGIVIGEVIVVTDPKDTLDVKDKILVTKMTDPGWVFLLTMAKGIIAEKGSLLSHTAIISRELKIPSVVGVDNITSILKTGDLVRVNGSTGTIEKMEK